MAVQASAEEHDTPKSWVVLTERLGMAWMLQLVPFQRSASGRPELVRVPWSPTAVQAFAEVHDTLRRKLSSAPAGLGTSWMLQLVPFQASAKARVVCALLS